MEAQKFSYVLYPQSKYTAFWGFLKVVIAGNNGKQKVNKTNKRKSTQGVCGSCYNTDRSEIQICLSANSCPLRALSWNPLPHGKDGSYTTALKHRKEVGIFVRGKLFPGRDRSYLSKSAGERQGKSPKASPRG